MHKKKTLLLSLALLSIIFLIIKCDDDDGYVDEKGFEIAGVVLDSASQLPIQGVIVGFTHYPDSIVVTGDSIYIELEYLYHQYSKTNDLGKFRISEIGAINMQDFQYMVAWKKDYKLWRFIHTPVVIVETKKSSYELTIYLSKK